jgi:hypothetical protein
MMRTVEGCFDTRHASKPLLLLLLQHHVTHLPNLLVFLRAVKHCNHTVYHSDTVLPDPAGPQLSTDQEQSSLDGHS